MKNIRFLWCLVCCLLVGWAQAQQGPGLLVAEGKIPKEFITPSTTKYKKQVAALDQSKDRKREKKDKKQFLLKSNFAIDDMLQSGMVLFNDPISIYLNQVLAKLPIKDPKLLKKKPRVYALNSSAVNAFATDQGIIFVTMGLLANLENEAQLAFILAHELVHVLHQHAIDQFVQAKNIDRDKARNARNMNVVTDRKLFEKSMYSRSLEEEADEEGLDLFLQSDYSTNSLSALFSILYYSYLPFEDYPFERQQLEDENYRFPDSRWLAEVKEISAMEEDTEEQKRSSHPSSLKRQEKVDKRIAEIDSEGKQEYLVGKEKFVEIQALARYQIPFLELYSESFPEAIYTSALLLREYPDDIELQKVIGKAIYLEAKYRNYEEAQDQRQNHRRRKLTKTKEGSIQRVYHLLTEMDHEELTVLALRYNWSLREKIATEDSELDAILQDVMEEFAEHFEDLDNFSKKARPVAAAPVPVDTTKAEGEKSKLEKIKDKEAEVDYWEYALVDILDQSKFGEAYEEALEEIAENEKRIAYFDTREGRKAYFKEKKREEKKGKQLGINKIVVVNPFYLSLDARKEGTVQYIRSEEKQVYFQETIRDMAKTKNVNAKVLDITDLSTKDIDKFNEIRELNNYFSQQMDQYDLSLTPSYHQAKIDAIAKKYGTDYFLWTGVISLREKNTAWGAVAISVIVPYLLPLTLANALTPEYDMLYYAILYDITTGRRSIIKMDYFNKRDSNSVLKSHMYDVFHQIKTKPKRG